MWLKDASAVGREDWVVAHARIANLNAGTNFSATEYTPGTYNDWRLPNLFEMHSLNDMEYFSPPISNPDRTGKWTPGNPFVDIPAKDDGAYQTFWTSTSLGGNPAGAWYVVWQDACIGRAAKINKNYIWPVRNAD